MFELEGPFHPPWQLQGPGRNATETAVAMHGCFLSGKAQANMSTGRIEVELGWMSCVMPNAATYEKEIRGYVTAQDHQFGLVGRIESHESVYLTRVFLTSALAGMAETFKLAQQTVIVTPFGGTTSTINGNVGQAAGFGALAHASAQLSTFYLQEVSQLKPALITDAETPAVIVLQEGVLLEDFPTRQLVAMR
jgi:hypothetical protein